MSIYEGSKHDSRLQGDFLKCEYLVRSGTPELPKVLALSWLSLRAPAFFKSSVICSVGLS